MKTTNNDLHKPTDKLKEFIKLSDLLNELGNYDDRKGYNCNGYIGEFASNNKNAIIIIRSYAAPFKGINYEELIIKSRGSKSRIWLTPETDSGPFVRDKIIDVNILEIMHMLVNDKDFIKYGPTGIYNRIKYLRLDKYGVYE